MTQTDTLDRPAPGRTIDIAGPTGGRIVLITSGGPMAWSVANALRKRFGEIVILEEEPERKWAIVRRRARLLGWLPALGQAASGIVFQIISRLSRQRYARIVATAGLDGRPSADIPVHRIGSVNSEAARQALRALNPAVVAVYGTRIIRRETLRAVAAPFINYHAGINPKYRGQHPGYWALVNGDAGNAGITVHLVDEGVDTGDVLYQASVDFTSADNITTYQWQQMTVALPYFARAIEDARAGRLKPYRVDLPTNQNFPPTLWTYLWNGLTKRVW